MGRHGDGKCYVSPNSGRAAFDSFLVCDFLTRYLPRQVLALGDFNTHATQWGNPRTDARGRALLNWTAGLGLLLVNRDSASICAVWGGGCSVIGLTWATPSTFRRVSDWRVDEETETLSDHLYIWMEVAPRSCPLRGPATSQERGAPAHRHQDGVRRSEITTCFRQQQSWPFGARRFPRRGAV